MSGDVAQGLCLLLVILAVFYLWDTPKKRDVMMLDSAQLAQMVARQGSKLKCTCGFFFACKPCSDRFDQQDEVVQRGELT